MNPFPQSGESYVLEQQARAGASWIYWIAGLSALDAIIEIAGVDRGFLVSLAAPMTVGAFAHTASDGALKAILGAIAIAMCAIFALFGYYAGKGARWAIVVAITCYAIDAVLWAVISQWFGVLLHAYALWRMSVGAKAVFGLAKLRKAAQMPAGFQGVRGMPNTENPGAWPAPPAAPPPISSLPAPTIPPSPFGQTTAPPASPLPQSPAEQPLSGPLIESSAAEPFSPQPPSDEQAR